MFVTPSLMRLKHLTCQEPALTGLITARNDRRSILCEILHVSGWLKMLALSQLIPSILSEPLEEGDKAVVHKLSFLRSTEIVSLEIRVVAAVE